MHITLRKPKKIIRENIFRYKPMGTSRTILALQSCDFPASAGNCTLRALDLYFKVAILQLELVLQSCDFQLELEPALCVLDFVVQV